MVCRGEAPTRPSTIFLHELHKAKRILQFRLRYRGILSGDHHSQSFNQLQLLLPFLGFDGGFNLLPSCPVRHHTSLTCSFELTHGLARYSVTVEGVCIVSSKYFWWAVLQEILTSCSRPSSFASDDITVHTLSFSVLNPSLTPSGIPA